MVLVCVSEKQLNILLEIGQSVSELILQLQSHFLWVRNLEATQLNGSGSGFLKTLQLSQALIEEGSTSKLTHVVAGRLLE